MSLRMTGRPRIDLNEEKFDSWDMLENLVLWSADGEYCAEKLGISYDTLARRIKEKYSCSFAEYRNKKKEPMRVNLLKKQYDVAMSGNVTMLIWLGKNELGQTDKQESVISNDKPLTFNVVSTKSND